MVIILAVFVFPSPEIAPTVISSTHIKGCLLYTSVEFIVCVKSILDGFVHQTMGTEECEEELDLNYMIGSSASVPVNVAMSKDVYKRQEFQRK